jgi:hypothetical protein
VDAGTADAELSAGVSGHGDGDDGHQTSLGGASDIGLGVPAFTGFFQTSTCRCRGGRAPAASARHAKKVRARPRA